MNVDGKPYRTVWKEENDVLRLYPEKTAAQ
jgi:hypothetical protein